MNYTYSHRVGLEKKWQKYIGKKCTLHCKKPKLSGLLRGQHLWLCFTSSFPFIYFFPILSFMIQGLSLGIRTHHVVLQLWILTDA